MEELILSSSSLKLFRNCRNAYKLGYVYNLDPIGTESEAVENGTEIHHWLELAAKGIIDWQEYAGSDSNKQVAMEYLRHHSLPTNIVMSEDREFFVKLLDDETWIRCTFDLVYERNGEIVIRDYKTFSRAPSLNLDLDFQARFYIAAAQKHFQKPVSFEYVFIRQTPPGVPKDKAGKCWEPEECYLFYPLDIPQAEADRVWAEAQWTATDLERALEDSEESGAVWYHNDRKGFGGCDSCFYKRLCAAENQMGSLDEETIAQLSKPREPLTLPERYRLG
jgi:hypothetical protein